MNRASLDPLSGVPRHVEHRQLGERPRWFNGAPALSIAVDPRGRYILTGGRRFLRLFHAETGELIRTLEGPGNAGSESDRIGFSQDGRFVLGHIGGTMDEDGALGVWDVETGALAQRLDTQPVGVVSAIDPRRMRVLARGPDAKPMLIDAERATMTLLEPRPYGGLGGGVFLDGDRAIGLASSGAAASLWDLPTGSAKPLDIEAFRAVAPRDADWFATTMFDVTIRAAKDGSVRRSFPDSVGRNAILSLDATPDGALLLAVSEVAAFAYRPDGTVVAHRDTIERAGGALSPDGRWFVLVAENAVIRRVWLDGRTPDDGPSPTAHTSRILEVAWSAGGALYSRDTSRSVRWRDDGSAIEEELPAAAAAPTWADARRGQISHWVENQYHDEGTALEQLVCGGDLAVSVDSHGVAAVWTRGGDAPLHRLYVGSTPGSNVLGSRVTSADIDARGRIAMASTRGDAHIQLWDGATGKPLAIFDGHENVPRAIAFSPDGKRMASGADDRTVRVWTLP